LVKFEALGLTKDAKLWPDRVPCRGAEDIHPRRGADGPPTMPKSRLRLTKRRTFHEGEISHQSKLQGWKQLIGACSSARRHSASGSATSPQIHRSAPAKTPTFEVLRRSSPRYGTVVPFGLRSGTCTKRQMPCRFSGCNECSRGQHFDICPTAGESTKSKSSSATEEAAASVRPWSGPSSQT
jgi:hypothetical protein